MTRSEQVARLAPYVRELADRLLLKDWRILISEQVADQDHNAEIDVAPGQHHAMIYLGHDFLDKSPEEMRYVLCHELIHCHFDAATVVAERDMDDLRRADFRMQVEYGVDDMARAVAPFMPLPTPDEPEKQAQTKRRKR